MVRQVGALYKRLSEIAQLSSQLSHDTLRQIFVEALCDFVEQHTGSRPIAQLEERLIQRSRTDARLGGITFEVKLPHESLDEAEEKVRDYLRQYRQQGINVRGVVYNGKQLVMLSEDGKRIGTYDAVAGAALLQSWLLLLSLKVLDPKALNILLGLSSPVAQQFVITLYNAFRQHRDQIGFIDEAYKVWKAVYGAAANLNKETREALKERASSLNPPIKISKSRDDALKFLFALESYLAILLRIFVTRLAVQQRLVHEPSVCDLLNPPGTSPLYRIRRLSEHIPILANVFEEDPFLWFCDAADADSKLADRLNALLIDVARIIDELDLQATGHDFLRRFYHQFFDPPLRRALGEFYTSEEIVKETLDAASFDGDLDGVLVDITCGSGSFLIEAIRRIIEHNRWQRGKRYKDEIELIRHITEKVRGIDLHPLAVAMARVNYLLALSPLLMPQVLRALGRLRLPIYWADSLAHLAKQRSFTHTEPIVEAPVPVLGDFALPDPKMVNWEQLFIALREAITVQRGKVQFEEAWQALNKRLPSQAIQQFENTLRHLLYEWVERHNNRRDTRWLPLLRNVLVIEELRGRCAFVVGNPPWVRIHNIEPQLRERVYKRYEFCRDAGWRWGCELAGIGVGFARQVDYCVPFVERALDLLRKGNSENRSGVLALVITSKIQQALYANRLRQRLLSHTKLLRLIDYSLYERELFENATNYPLILAAEKISHLHEAGENCIANNTVEVTLVNRLGRRETFRIPQAQLPLLTSDLESPWVLAPPQTIDVFRKMQKGVKLLGESSNTRPRRGVLTDKNSLFIVTRVEPTESRNEVLVTTEEGEAVRLEKNLLRPMLRGEDVKAWRYEVKEHILWTHDDTTGKVLPDLPKRAKEYFESHSQDLRERSDYREGDPIWTIYRVSPEKLKDKVVWQELSHEMEAVYVPRFFRGQLLIPIQTAYLLSVPSREAGLIVSAWLNSLPVRAYLSSFAERARGSYFRHIGWVVACLPIPSAIWAFLNDKCKKVSVEMKSLIEISEALHNDPSQQDAAKLEDKLAELVTNLYNLSPVDLQTIRDYWSFVRASI